MRRPLVWVAASALVSVYGAVTGIVWCIYVYLAVLMCIAMMEYKRNSKGSNIKKAFKYSIVYIVICSLISLSAFLYATGKVSQSKFNFPDDTIYKATVLQVSSKDYGYVLMTQYQEHKLMVTLYDSLTKPTNYEPEVGDTIEFMGESTEIEGPRNEGEFDVKTYYSSLGIFHNIKADKIINVEYAEGMQKAINEIKKRFNTIYNHVAKGADAGVLQAVVLGDKTNLDDNLYDLYRKNGIAHILAISGLHITFIGNMIYRLLRRCVSGYIIPFGGAMTVLLLYTVMTGNSVSAKRAVIMCVVSMGADVLGRTYDVLSALSLSAIMIIYENVYIIFNSGFQLSFGAILGIACVYPAFSKIFVEPIDKMADRLDRKRQVAKRQLLKGVTIILGNLFCSLSVSLVTLPVIMYNYYQVPMYSVFINIIVIPLMSLLLLCALLVGTMGLVSMPVGTFFMGTVHYILVLYTSVCDWFDNLKGNILVTGKPEIADCIVFYLLLALFVVLITYGKVRKYDYDKKSRGDGLYVGIIAIALIIVIPPTDENFTIRMLDVGQGDCIWVQYNGENYLFDGGSTDIDAVGERRIYPCLRAGGVKCIDYIFVSHADKDHTSGIIELMTMQDKTFVINNLVLPRIKDADSQENYMELIRVANESGVNIMYVSAGTAYTTPDGEMMLKCLHPYIDYEYASSNDYSAVYKLTRGDFDMLLTGDVEESGEKAILERYVKASDTTLLKVAHHGSKNSSCKEFLVATKPRYAIISCGKNNMYGHPSNETLERLMEVGARVYITAECGQITVRVGKRVSISGYINKDSNI